MDAVTIELSPIAARVLGSLVEKEITTPEYYPLSMNALANACNQKNNREPVTNLDEDEIRQALHRLEDDGLAGAARGTESRVAKYEHHMQEVFNFTRGEIAVMCVLLLRGPQTPGELRGQDGTHAPLRGAERRAIDAATADAARAAAGDGAAPPARHQGSPLRPSFVGRGDGGSPELVETRSNPSKQKSQRCARK